MDLPFGIVNASVTYAYEGEHGYFRQWIDRHGWGEPSKARAVRLVPYVTTSGEVRTSVIVCGDRGQCSHREYKAWTGPNA